MKLYPFQIVCVATSVAALLLFVSCASKPEDESNTSTVSRHGVPGGTWVESYKTPVTIAAIDPANRKVTLVASDNTRNTFTAGPDFKEFDQIRVGDHFQAAVARESSIFMRQDGMPPAGDISAAKEMIKDGKYSGRLKADTVEKTARITALNPNQSYATLQFADGTTQDITVKRDVDLWNFKVGQEVVIRTRSVAVLNLEKP